MKVIRKIQYNSPVILTYAIISLLALFLSEMTGHKSNMLLFSVYQSPLTDPLFYVRLFGHIFGHIDTTHYANNFILILLIGPILEEKYGSLRLVIMIAATALITGLLNVLLFPNVMLLGASGIVFMLILLSSFVNLQKGRIPLTLLLVIVVFIGRELVQSATVTDNISQLTHVVGAICGACLGYFSNKDKLDRTEA